jgi:hypothetical protein
MSNKLIDNQKKTKKKMFTLLRGNMPRSQAAVGALKQAATHEYLQIVGTSSSSQAE